jgi:hypothetical protein
MRTNLLLVLSLLLAAGCDRARDTEPPATPLHVPSDSGIDAFFAQGPIEVGPSRAELVAQLGEPDSVSVRTVQNRHDPSVTDTIATYYFAGLTAEIHVAGYDGKEILAALDIADDRYLRSDSPVRLRDTAEAVRAVLGEPDESGEAYLEYHCDDCLAAGQETTRFVLTGGLVTRIEVRYWVD